MNATYIIPGCNVVELEARIAKLNRRAVKIGVQPITFTKAEDHAKARVEFVLSANSHVVKRAWIKPEEIGQHAAKWTSGTVRDTGERMTYWAVEINGETPSLAGWTFIAVLAPMTTDDGDAVNFVSTLPGESCPVEYRDRIGECDHCKATRRRKETFVVRHSDGATKVVGRQCIKDFLGDYTFDSSRLTGHLEP